MGHHLEFVKERVTPDTLLDFLQAFVDHAAGAAAFDLVVGDQVCSFPAHVLERSAIDIEYEHDPDKTELEITVEWRHDER